MHTVKPWSLPNSYMGATWYGFYSSGFSQHRDSDALERTNFQAAWAALKNDREINLGTAGPDNGDPTVQIVGESHWAVGWIEWIAIHESDTEALRIAQELCDRANDYPVLDEDLFSRIEDEDCEATWRSCFSERERIAYFREHSYTATSFAALLRAVRGDWYEAASMLHSPSDLLY
jgi:hypothetical protein